MKDHLKTNEPEKPQKLGQSALTSLVMPDFERENRYIVIKRSDIAGCERVITPAAWSAFETIMKLAELSRTNRGKSPLCCVVVEHDWPEYEPIWKAIKERVKSEELKCPQCNSWEGLKFPRGLKPYCEDCGWPDDDFGEA